MNLYFKKALRIYIGFAVFLALPAHGSRLVCASGVARSSFSSSGLQILSETDLTKFSRHGFHPQNLRFMHVLIGPGSLEGALEIWSSQINLGIEDRSLRERAAFRSYTANETMLAVLNQKNKPEEFFWLANYVTEGAKRVALVSAKHAHMYWGTLGNEGETPQLESPEKVGIRNKAHGAIEYVGALGRFNAIDYPKVGADIRPTVEIRHLQIPPAGKQKTQTDFLWLAQPKPSGKQSDLLISISDAENFPEPSPDDLFPLGTIVTPMELWKTYSSLLPKSP